MSIIERFATSDRLKFLPGLLPHEPFTLAHGISFLFV